MDNNLLWNLEKKVERTIKNLEKNNMEAFYVKDEKELKLKLSHVIKEGSIVSVGGSMTLFELGVINFLRDGKYKFLDRYENDLTPEQIKKIYRETFSADIFLSSSNAITEQGELYNVDGNGNRVAPIIYGPDEVIIICGVNKIVKDINEAEERLRRVAAPTNAKRLNKDTPCVKLGYCMDCKSEDRICSDYVIMRRQKVKGRIKVIIVGKQLGY
ncbi:L-lactate utilization protein LutB [Clostridium tetanomorphum]|uniref:Lactate utilization protein n=1 Tax=Clostridium tetanomorphum TaxID=1553 RepID=A0A923EBI8_CLOTT|nr:lactate utilization protein [Clostridium tetanomorphum]KAJ53794.1 hypothetical protein CTM_00955 [Clostridium tetanomorphum DSM 665]MBC2397308.1 lactate utilization protein [Clostridium tetanomorphum]MBP1862527.1 L-lactate utilization protein LutB [Clostridium tetanomorphum]NRS85632.1 L-lactate utilization protein LutB [Clostridium tetanomorphum]NRZ96357.1 L-lactate utilization protein LutB [Clostridium tetanomorphum]